MSNVFFDVAISLDGYMAPKGKVDPENEAWMQDWKQIVGWLFPQQFIRENLQLGEGGETGQENRLVQEAYDRTGASIMGKNMFDGGVEGWPEEAPFHTPVFVLTHEARDPWERPGGTTFHFVNDGIHAALARAKKAAGDRDVRIAGGVETVQQFLNAGLVDEFTLHQVPAILGRGLRLFDDVDASRFSLTVVEALDAPGVAHLRYQVDDGEEASDRGPVPESDSR